MLFSSRFFRSPNPKKERNSHTMPPAPVPETALKKRRRDEEWAAARASAAAEARSELGEDAALGQRFADLDVRQRVDAEMEALRGTGKDQEAE